MYAKSLPAADCYVDICTYVGLGTGECPQYHVTVISKYVMFIRISWVPKSREYSDILEAFLILEISLRYALLCFYMEVGWVDCIFLLLVLLSMCVQAQTHVMVNYSIESMLLVYLNYKLTVEGISVTM